MSTSHPYQCFPTQGSCHMICDMPYLSLGLLLGVDIGGRGVDVWMRGCVVSSFACNWDQMWNNNQKVGCTSVMKLYEASNCIRKFAIPSLKPYSIKSVISMGIDQHSIHNTMIITKNETQGSRTLLCW